MTSIAAWVRVTCSRCGLQKSAYRYADLTDMGWTHTRGPHAGFVWTCPNCQNPPPALDSKECATEQQNS
jgi:hypothetical protein